MIDQELIARLRNFDPHWHELEVVDEAADRIEELGKERDRFEAALARCCLVGGTTYFWERIYAAEAKLTKAVEALRKTDQAIMLHTDETSWRVWGEVAVSDIRKVLAELEEK